MRTEVGGGMDCDQYASHLENSYVHDKWHRQESKYALAAKISHQAKFQK